MEINKKSIISESEKVFSDFSKKIKKDLKSGGFKGKIKLNKEKALSGSLYIELCLIDNDRYEFFSLVRVADHHKSFQSEGIFGIISKNPKYSDCGGIVEFAERFPREYQEYIDNIFEEMGVI